MVRNKKVSKGHLCHESGSGQPDCSGQKTVPVPFIFAPKISRGLAQDRKRSPRLDARDKPPHSCYDCEHCLKCTSYIRNPASCKMGTVSFPGVKCGRGVLLNTHPLLVPRSWKSRAIPLPTLWATPGLKREHFTFTVYK